MVRLVAHEGFADADLRGYALVTETSMMFMTPTPPTMKVHDAGDIGEHEEAQAPGDLIPEAGQQSRSRRSRSCRQPRL